MTVKEELDDNSLCEKLAVEKYASKAYRAAQLYRLDMQLESYQML